MSKKKKIKNDNVEIWTEEESEEYLKGLYGMDFIEGFTENGMPYGTFAENEDEDEDKVKEDSGYLDDELPF